jgi:hypothetical protein
VGQLFNEQRIEMLGVQNIVQTGSSGGPLISPDDDQKSFMGIGKHSFDPEFCCPGKGIDYSNRVRVTSGAACSWSNVHHSRQSHYDSYVFAIYSPEI